MGKDEATAIRQTSPSSAWIAFVLTARSGTLPTARRERGGVGTKLISSRLYRFAAVIVVGFAMAFPAHAQTESGVRVATRVLPPVVIDKHDILSGFSIDIWNAIAERSHLRTNFLVAPDVTGLLDEVRSGKARVGIAADYGGARGGVRLFTTDHERRPADHGARQGIQRDQRSDRSRIAARPESDRSCKWWPKPLI